MALMSWTLEVSQALMFSLKFFKPLKRPLLRQLRKLRGSISLMVLQMSVFVFCIVDANMVLSLLCSSAANYSLEKNKMQPRCKALSFVTIRATMQTKHIFARQKHITNNTETLEDLVEALAKANCLTQKLPYEATKWERLVAYDI